MENIILISVPETTLGKIVENAVRDALANYKGNIYNAEAEEKDEILTRRQAAEMLKISLPTLSDWTRYGKLIGYRIGASIRYKKKEVEQSLLRMQHNL